MGKLFWLSESPENICKQFEPKMSSLIWIQTVWHSDGIPEKNLLDFSYKKSDDKTKLPSMQS